MSYSPKKNILDYIEKEPITFSNDLAIKSPNNTSYVLSIDDDGILGGNGMPKHLAIGKNVLHGTAHFSNSKTMPVIFPIAFNRPPMVKLTACDSGRMPLYKTSVTKSSFIIKCKQKWTGSVDWEVTERG